MKYMFADELAYQELIKNDPVVYDFYDMQVPSKHTELAYGTSITYPGKVGSEYFMTKGHFHEVFDTAEIYYCLRGRGIILMETPEGQWSAKELTRGKAVYVPGGWAHRSINIDTKEPFITFFVFRGDAGHDYASIEQKGFQKIVVEVDGKPTILDNPKWR